LFEDFKKVLGNAMTLKVLHRSLNRLELQGSGKRSFTKRDVANQLTINHADLEVQSPQLTIEANFFMHGFFNRQLAYSLGQNASEVVRLDR
jgi:hypothetical protein